MTETIKVSITEEHARLTGNVAAAQTELAEVKRKISAGGRRLQELRDAAAELPSDQIAETGRPRPKTEAAKLNTELRDLQRMSAETWPALLAGAEARVAEARNALGRFVEANRYELLAELEPAADAAVDRLEVATIELEAATASWFEVQGRSGALIGRRRVSEIPGGDELTAFARAARSLRNRGVPKPYPREPQETVIGPGL